MKAQPLIAVQDVEASSQWYQRVLGLKSGHGGPDYERLLFHDEIVLQLHRWQAHEHPHLGGSQSERNGNGVVLWFQSDKVLISYQTAIQQNAKVLEPLKLNSQANHREFWLADPDGYVVVVAGAYGDIED